MKRRILLIILIITAVLAISAALLFAYRYMGENDGDNKGYVCYSAVEVSSDGDEVTAEGLKKHLGVKNVDYVMSVMLKDTGDCGVYMVDYGFLGRWKENEEDDVITISGADRDIKLEKKWGKLVFEENLNGNKIKIVLEKTEGIPESFADHPEYTFGTFYNSKATQDLCNFMIDGHYCMKGSSLYGRFFDSKGNAMLGCCEITGGRETIVGDVKPIAKEGIGKFLTMNDDYLYYMWAPSSGSTESICRVSLEGGEPEVIREGACDYVQVRYDKIYFTNENYRLCRMNLDGSKEKLIMDKEVYMPYVFDRNWIMYQDDADGEKLHVGTLDGKYDKAITYERSYEWVIQGRNLYYTSTPEQTETGKHKCQLHRFNISELKKTEDGMPGEVEAGEGFLSDAFVLNRENIFGGNGASVELAAWKSLSNNLYETTGAVAHIMYISDRYKIIGYLDDAGNISDIQLTNFRSGKSHSVLQ